MRLAILIAAFLIVPGVAYAYTGPGLGLGAIVAVLAVIFSSVLAVLAVFWYPLKRLIKGRKKAADARDGETGDRDGDA